MLSPVVDPGAGWRQMGTRTETPHNSTAFPHLRILPLFGKGRPAGRAGELGTVHEEREDHPGMSGLGSERVIVGSGRGMVTDM
jgi:hypothetical protein